MNRFLYKILMFLTIPLFVVVLVEIICVKLNVPKISYPNIVSKSQNLIPQINSNTILFLGDSRVEWGVKPEIIKNSLTTDSKINVLNLAMPGSNGLDILAYLKAKSVYPRLIILGYTSNYGRYTNHGLDKIKYTKRNRIEESIKYYLKQNSFVYDYTSILVYIKGDYPLHIGHEYDEWGGVNVTEYGDYKYKKGVQTKIYKQWSRSFEKEKLNVYNVSIKQFKKWFNQGGTSFYGLYMPTSKELLKLEEKNYNNQNDTLLFERYYDYSRLKYYYYNSLPDSIFFYDGSHLTLEYANLFSEKFAKEIKKVWIDTIDYYE